MKRFITAYFVESDKVEVYTEDQTDEIKEAQATCDEWVWQFAKNKEIAKQQHFDKHDEWECDPTKETY